MARLAIGLEVPPDIIANQYTALIPKLSLFRDGGTKAFTDVAKAATQMGLDIDTGAQSLFDLSEGFMDFESAADKVASINVVLGGSFVNAFDMVLDYSKTHSLVQEKAWKICPSLKRDSWLNRWGLVLII